MRFIKTKEFGYINPRYFEVVDVENDFYFDDAGGRKTYYVIRARFAKTYRDKNDSMPYYDVADFDTREEAQDYLDKLMENLEGN